MKHEKELREGNAAGELLWERTSVTPGTTPGGEGTQDSWPSSE